MTSTTTLDREADKMSVEDLLKRPRLLDIVLSDIDRSRNHRHARPGDEERIAQLADSIRQRGQLQPVRVYQRAEGEPGLPYILGFGARRCMAVESLGLTRIRAEVYPPTPDHEIEAARAVENLDRQDITPIEEAQAVADIIHAYLKSDLLASHQEAIEHAASEVGRSVTWVRDRDYFARLTEPVRELAMRTGLPAGHLRELAKLGDPEIQWRVALESMNAWPHYFKKGTLDPAPSYKEEVAELFGEINGGQVHRWSIKRLAAKVAEYQRSLRSVPWQLGLPVLAGKDELPACDRCPHNTATDLTLFGLEDVEDKKALARCMNPTCFERKSAVAETARQKAVRHAVKRIGQEKQADDAGLRKDADSAVAKAPDWLDPKKLTAYVKGRQKKAKESGGDTKSTTTARGGGGYGKRAFTPHETAINKYNAAVEQWMRNATDAMAQLVGASLLRAAAWRLLSVTQMMQDIQDSQVRLLNPSPYCSPETQSPRPAGKLPLSLSSDLSLAGSGSAVDVIGLAKLDLNEYGDGMSLDNLPKHPEFIRKLIEAFGGDSEALGAFPEWSDYDPAAATKAGDKEPAAKKKSKKKAVAG